MQSQESRTQETAELMPRQCSAPELPPLAASLRNSKGCCLKWASQIGTKTLRRHYKPYYKQPSRPAIGLRLQPARKASRNLFSDARIRIVLSNSYMLRGDVISCLACVAIAARSCQGTTGKVGKVSVHQVRSDLPGTDVLSENEEASSSA